MIISGAEANIFLLLEFGMGISTVYLLTILHQEMF